MCVLKGFPTALEVHHRRSRSGCGSPTRTRCTWPTRATATTPTPRRPARYTTAAAQTTAGLQKWVLQDGSWQLAYTLTSGLNLGTPYQVPGYPTGDNAATGLPWAPATDGLRNIIGRVNRDGTVTIWAVTSTVSGGGDQGADPNKVVAITDNLGAQTLPAGESFRTVRGRPVRRGAPRRVLHPGHRGALIRLPTGHTGTGGRVVPAARSSFSVRLRWC